MDITTALSKFLIQLQADGRAASTISQYQRHVRLFAHWITQDRDCADLFEISHHDIARFLASPQARTRRHGGFKSETTMNVLRSSLKAFFRYLNRAGIIPHDPGQLIRRAICSSPPPRTLSDKESARLMAKLEASTNLEGKRDYMIFHLMLATGIRLGSAVGLDAEDVDLEQSQMLIRSTKRNQPDWVMLGKKIKAHLRRYLRDHAGGPLFTNRKDQRISTRQVQRRFQEWIKKAGIKRSATVHCLRHTLGTNLYRQTRDVFLVKEMLRHKSIASTIVYTRMEENLRRAIRRKIPQYC